MRNQKVGSYRYCRKSILITTNKGVAERAGSRM
jgi:hypothetical protein